MGYLAKSDRSLSSRRTVGSHRRGPDKLIADDSNVELVVSIEAVVGQRLQHHVFLHAGDEVDAVAVLPLIASTDAIAENRFQI